MAGLQAGTARVDSTPPVGIDLTGFIARQNPSIGVHDPLYVRALVLDDGECQAAVVACDLIGLDRLTVAALRTAIEKTTGIPAAQILIAGTHTHAGPATLFVQGCGNVDAAWMEELQRRIVAAVKEAHANLRPAQLAAGRGQMTTGVHNRRTAGDLIDPELGVVRLTDSENRPIAVLLNYACHPTCLDGSNRYFSADYPGQVVAVMEQATGAVTLFLTGAIGDVGPVQRGWPVVEQIGTALAVEGLRVLENIAPCRATPLTAQSQMLPLPLLALPTVEAMRQTMDENRRRLQEIERAVAPDPIQLRIARAHSDWSDWVLEALQQYEMPTTVQGEVQVIRLGDVALVGVPGELFVELGLAIKAAGAPGIVLVCGFANDNIGYIPTRRAYAQGGYEIDDAYKYYGYPAALAPEAGERVVESASRYL